MGIFERISGDDVVNVVRGIDPHAISFALFELAVNAEYSGSEAPLATKPNLIVVFDLQNLTGGGEGPRSDIEDLDAMIAFYGTLSTNPQKDMYRTLIMSTFHLVHAGVYSPTQGRDNLHLPTS